MKKIMSLVLALCLVCLSAALAEGNDVTGDWYGSMYGLAVQMTMNEDGTYMLKAIDMEMEQPGTYELKDGIVYMDESEDPEEGFVFDGASLVNEKRNVTFTREQVEVEALVLAEADPEAPAEAFEGEWTCNMLKMSGRLFDVAQVPVESLGLEGIPSLRIEGSAVSFIGFGNLMDAEPLAFEYADGVLKYVMIEGIMETTITMLQDGTILLDLGIGEEGPFFCFAPATAAEDAA
ncbi:MAG: hypothetical protein IKH81_06530 [Clostridia bacterium]|nr:hypothetical protein [Clostridia bacterium]